MSAQAFAPRRLHRAACRREQPENDLSRLCVTDRSHHPEPARQPVQDDFRHPHLHFEQHGRRRPSVEHAVQRVGKVPSGPLLERHLQDALVRIWLLTAVHGSGAAPKPNTQRPRQPCLQVGQRGADGALRTLPHKCRTARRGHAHVRAPGGCADCIAPGWAALSCLVSGVAGCPTPNQALTPVCATRCGGRPTRTCRRARCWPSRTRSRRSRTTPCLHTCKPPASSGSSTSGTEAERGSPPGRRRSSPPSSWRPS